MRVIVERQRLHLSRPLRTGHGTISIRESLLVGISDGAMTGWGEAAPLPSYDRGSLEKCAAALDGATEILTDGDPDDPDATLAKLDESIPTQALAAIEVALLDLAARRSDVPVWSLLGALTASPIECSSLIQATTPTEALEELRKAEAAGFTAVKLKAGFDGDIEFLASILEACRAFSHVTVDANGRWSPAEARTAMDTLSSTGRLSFEQPVASLDGMRSLMAAGTGTARLILDECATEPEAFRGIPAAHACTLKLQAWGGCRNLIHAAGKARAIGMDVMLGSTLEGPVGTAASLHCAAALAPELPSGLATLDMFAETSGLGWVQSGAATIPSGPGLGVGPLGLAG